MPLYVLRLYQFSSQILVSNEQTTTPTTTTATTEPTTTIGTTTTIKGKVSRFPEIFYHYYWNYHHYCFRINLVYYELVISYQHYLSGNGGWVLRTRGSSNENGCSNKDEIRGVSKATLAVCKDFCKDTKFLQYHASTHCGCYKVCDFKRPAKDYGSKADIYEQQPNFGMLSSTKYNADLIISLSNVLYI